VDCLIAIHGVAGVSDANRVPDGDLSICLVILALHAFAASLYDMTLSAAIRFFMQPTICTTI